MKATKFLYILLGLFVFQSCTDVIDLDLDETEILLVVEGEVNDVDSVQWVRLSRTTDYFENLPPNYSSLSDATVTLYQNGALYDTMAFNTSTERFEVNLRADSGEVYFVRIELANGKSYQSLEERINRVPSIDTIWYEVNDNPTFGDETEWDIFIESQELEGIGDYYQWKVYLNGEYQDEPEDLTYAEDDVVDGNYISEFDVYSIEEEDYDELIAGRDSIDVVVVQSTISRENFQFLSDLQSQTAFQGGPFSPPPAGLRGNISSIDNDDERVLGFFAAVAKRSASIRVR